MPAMTRISPTDLFTPEEWAHLRRRSDLMGIGMVAHAWALIAAAMALGIWLPWLIPLSIMIIGARQLGLAILMHEASHGGLHRDQKLNDFIGEWLCAAPTGARLADYRPYHLGHHKFTQQPEDPDLILSAPFPVTKASLRRKIIRDLTGQTFWKQRKNQFANALGLGIRQTPGAENRMQSARAAVIPMLITNAIIALILTVTGHWWAFFVLWLLPMATWFPLVTRLRNIAEHALTRGDDVFRQARTTHANLIERLLIAPYWVNYHLEHHLFMHLPCYRLRETHLLLEEKGITAKMEIQPGYLTVLRLASSRPASVPA